MTAQEWSDYIGTLDAHDRLLAQSIMDRMVHVLEKFRSQALADTQKLERRLDEHKQRIADLSARIAALERDADGT